MKEVARDCANESSNETVPLSIMANKTDMILTNHQQEDRWKRYLRHISRDIVDTSVHRSHKLRLVHLMFHPLFIQARNNLVCVSSVLSPILLSLGTNRQLGP